MPPLSSILAPNHDVAASCPPARVVERTLKRLLDVAIAGFALAALAPLIAFTALAVRLDSPGPVLFRQQRSGLGQQRFTILKFRTMRDAVSQGTVQARRGDERVTRVGAVLRRSSMDEVPQLLNVLRGEMSLVGPRPHAVAHDQEYQASIGNYNLRHRVKPGMTGWAQVNKRRGETADPASMAARIELDLWYIDHWSLLLDLRILGRTVFEVLRLEAY